MLRNSVMVSLTIIFVWLYTSPLVGWLRPITGVTMITRLEPIIFVIMGYSFGRLPAKANERSLKNEIEGQTNHASASRHAKEAAQKEREVMEEKITNARIALVGVRTKKINSSPAKDVQNAATANSQIPANPVGTAMSILDS